MALAVKTKNAESFLSQSEIEKLLPELSLAHSKLIEKSGAGSDFTGWVTLPQDYDRDEFARIKAAAEKIRSDSKVLIVIGIGGSYLGARAAIEFLKSPYHNHFLKDEPEIYFAGNSVSADYYTEIVSLIGDRDFSINVISKSGTTTEPAIAFRLFKDLIEKKYGKDEAKHRIYATTDKSRGALKQMADAEGYQTFIIPDDVGGRYSVLTAVGLLPIAVAGIDIDRIMSGAQETMNSIILDKSLSNPAWRYAGFRNALYRKGKKIEILACFEPRFRFMAEWWKQLYGESEGKNGLGLFPASVELSTDLHSMGQYIQDGERILIETMFTIATPDNQVLISSTDDNLDGLNFLAGQTMDFVNKQSFAGTVLAHVDGGVPNLEISIPKINEESFGSTVYFFEFACALSGYVLGVNPFDQPGVEDYKKNMFALINKPGYQDARRKLLERL